MGRVLLDIWEFPIALPWFINVKVVCDRFSPDWHEWVKRADLFDGAISNSINSFESAMQSLNE